MTTGLREAFDRCMAQNRRFHPGITDRIGIEPGFWGVEERLLGALGFKFFAPKSITPRTTANVPGREDCRIDLILIDGLNFTKDMSAAQEMTTSFLADTRAKNAAEYKAMDASAAEAILGASPLYPDMELPTYTELYEAIADKELSFERPFLSNREEFVDPDFYINCMLPEDPLFMDTAGIIQTASIKTTVTSRFASDDVHEVSPADPTRTTSSVDKTKTTTPPEPSPVNPKDDLRLNTPNGSTDDISTTDKDDPVVPVKGEASVRGSFYDFQNNEPLNRLVLAFPTIVCAFYREGAAITRMKPWHMLMKMV
jgi:hypothetical protein